MAKKHKAKAQTLQPIPEHRHRRIVPVLGAPYRFTPAAFYQERSAVLPGQKPIPREVTGTITYINWPHSWFLVAYTINGYQMRQAIKF